MNLVKEIPLTQGYVALVDDEDYERVSAFKWYSLVSSINVYAIVLLYFAGEVHRTSSSPFRLEPQAR